MKKYAIYFGVTMSLNIIPMIVFWWKIIFDGMLTLFAVAILATLLWENYKLFRKTYGFLGAGLYTKGMQGRELLALSSEESVLYLRARHRLFRPFLMIPLLWPFIFFFGWQVKFLGIILIGAAFGIISFLDVLTADTKPRPLSDADSEKREQEKREEMGQLK